ncbi:MAG: hypothetical protein C5B54_01940 [Acidobacteria bacterium]|nr:MAG: hypothetical protein C5B54_01940 [Acidobacteriota bacterium]
MSYLDYYHLLKEPFSVTPDPEFLFLGSSHKEALATIIFGITKRKGIIAITGEVGVGKTMILRSYLESSDPGKLKVVYIFNSDLSFESLLRVICRELDLQTEGKSVPDMVDTLHRELIKEYSAGGNIAVIVDEAQNMPVETLERLRMLSNLETSKHKLMQIVLIGQPELEDKLNFHELRQLKQRIALRTTILPLTTEESYLYLEHRLNKVGAKREALFAKDASKLLLTEARGIPRLINILADNALITGFGYQQNPVKANVVKEVIEDIRGRKSKAGAFKPKPVLALIIPGILLASLLWFASSRGLTEVRIPTSEPKAEVAANRVPTPAGIHTAAPMAQAEQKQTQINPKPLIPAPAKSVGQSEKEIVPTQPLQVSPVPPPGGEQTSTSNAPIQTQTPAAPLQTQTPAPAPAKNNLPQQPPRVETKTQPPEQKTVEHKPADSQKPQNTSAKQLTEPAAPKPPQQSSQDIRPKKLEHQSERHELLMKQSKPVLEAKNLQNPVDAKSPAPQAKSDATADPVPHPISPATNKLAEPADNSNPKPAVDSTNKETKKEPAITGQSEVVADSAPATPAQQSVQVTKPIDPSEALPAPGVTNADPKLIGYVSPIYSDYARKRRLEGTVLLNVLITEKGDPALVEVAEGINPILDDSARTAVKKWKFSPPIRDGKPSREWIKFRVVFKLQHD